MISRLFSTLLVSVCISAVSLGGTIVVVEPPASWGTTGTGGDTNPSGQWSVYHQVTGAAQTDAYTLGTFVNNVNYKGWGVEHVLSGSGVVTQVSSDSSLLSMMTWSTGAGVGQWGVVEYVVPVGFDNLINITGRSYTNTGVWNYIEIYKLSADGTTAQALDAFNITTYQAPPNPSSYDIDLTFSAVGGERIIYRNRNGQNNYSTNYLENYTITLVPEPTTLGLLGLGGLMLIRRKK